MLDKISKDNNLIKQLSQDELEDLSNALREKIEYIVCENGGHLASNLGVVELTVALHYVFDFKTDKVIFDVGHQCYTHKILTDRYDKIDTLRKMGGISGFPKREESEFDHFNTGHASTSISAALGMAKARDLKGENHEVIAVIGDGSFGGGMVYEALNNISSLNSKILIILNDNEMSISKSVGGIPKHLSKLRVNLKYRKLKMRTRAILNKIPLIGKFFIAVAESIKNYFGKLLLHKVALFEHLGIKYIGPIDGNDIGELIKFLNKIKYIDQPILLHIVTKKGKGSYYCEQQPENSHGLKPKDTEYKNEYSKVLGSTIVELAEKNEKIVALSAAMTSSVGLAEFKEKFPDRFIDTGISESHTVTLAAGIAVGGYKPYFCVYSTFLQRGFDQVLHDVCLQNLPVVFCLDRAGITGEDGETHHGAFDLSYLSLIPNITVAVPKDAHEFKNMLIWSQSFDRPLAIRYPRESKRIYLGSDDIEHGKWEFLEKGGSDIVILAVGERIIGTAMDLKSELLAVNINISIVNARFVKPLDTEMLNQLKGKILITLEENTLIGGFGSLVNQYYNDINANTTIKNFGYTDEFIPHGDIESLSAAYGLNYNDIKEYIISAANK